MATSFIDKATIRVIAGKGGDGAVAFHREKYVAAGGPDGGDGGKGGNIIAVVDDHMSTLMDFRYKRKYVASNGMNGQGKRCNGKDGECLTIKVPRGTLIRDKETGCILHDMSDNEPYIIAKGGKGGWGNMHFATPTRQVPRFSKPGQQGEDKEIILELKLLADVGLVGFPNVGKSTLLSVVSKAHPKIANYHFTTLYPNLGVVYVSEGESFVMADIPGIIEGASQGIGLGHDFLRHIDRCRLLVHLIDVSGSEGRNPIDDFYIINEELKQYNIDLANRPQIVVANKCDLLGNDRSIVEELKAETERHNFQFFEISAAAHQGTQELVKEISRKLSSLPPVIHYESDYIPPVPILESSEALRYEQYDDDYWSVSGAWIDKLLLSVNLNDYESQMYFDRVLRENGVFQHLEDLGIKDGDTVSIGELEFEYQS